MTEDVKTWCFDPATDTLDKIQQSAVEYYEALELYHKSISEEVWSNIEFESTISKSLDLETKPDFKILYELSGEFVNNDWSWFEKGSLIRYQETLKNNELRLFAETKDRLAKYQYSSGEGPAKYKEEMLFTGNAMQFSAATGQPYTGGMFFFTNQNTGSWTMLMVYGDGMACMVANGKQFAPYSGKQPNFNKDDL